MAYEFLFLKALLITVSVETIVLFLLFRTIFKTTNAGNFILLFTGILASMTTLPYAWFILPAFISSKIYYIAFAELSVTFVESFIIMGIIRISYTKALIASVICNAASFLVGLCLHF
jgi:hypothetical protein